MNTTKALRHLSTAAILATFFSLTHASAADQTMANYVGTYKVKDCAYTENYVSNPKDYYCHFTEIRVAQKDANSYEISYTDELGQKRSDIVMNEFRRDDKDGSQIQASFSNTEYSAAWTLNKSNSADGSWNSDNRTFSIDTTSKVVTYDHQITISNQSNYKSADWSYSLEKQ